MSSQPKDASESFRQAQTGAASVSRLEPVRALHRVLAEIAHGPYSQDASAELLAVLANELGTSGCHIVVLDRDDDADGNEVLIPLASAGQYGALLRDMPPIELDSPLEAARVFRNGEAHFVDSLHLPSANEKTEGTGRWRQMIATQSYAVLPLMLGGDSLGVLTLQWSAPVDFDDAFRATLESIATAAALTISLTRTAASGHDAALDLLISSHAKIESVSVTAFGAKRAEGGMDPETVLVATVDVYGAEDVVFEHAEPEGEPARLLMLAPDGPEGTLPESARSLAAASVRLSGSPSEWLDTINRSLPRGGSGVRAWGASFDPRTGVLLEVSAGVVSTVVANATGTEQQNEFKQLPLGLWAEESYVERPRLLIPGDSLEACIEDGPDLTLAFLTRAPQE